MTIYFDRSRRADFEKCPRKRYWGYEYQGRGIQPLGTQRSDWALMTGIGVHEGVGQVAQGISVDSAITRALAIVDYGNLQMLSEDEKEIKTIDEQVALIKGLIHCWAVIYYPQFNIEFEVLAVEREEQVELAPGVVMMVRPDLLVRRRSDGALFTWQLKTTKRADEKWQAQWPLDQMTISEVLAVEEGLDRHKYGEETCVSGVIVQGLVKGDQSEWPKGSGNWSFNSPLIYAWHNESGKPQPQGDWTARFAWTDEFGSHRLGKGWRKLAVWSDYPGGIAAWISWLQQNDPAILEQQIITLQPILRAPHEIARWKPQVIVSELKIRQARRVVEMGGSLDEMFPMHTSGGNCIWPYRCAYFDICHGMTQPDDSELFKPRELNHPQEKIDESSGSWIVIGNYSERVTAVQSVDMTNPSEWKLVRKAE